MKNFTITTKSFGKIAIADAPNDNKCFAFLDSKTIGDAVIDDKHNMHASFVYDDLPEDEVYLEWIDCYSNCCLSKHKLEDVFNLDKLEDVLTDGYNQVLEQGFGVDFWDDYYNEQE